MSQKSENRPRTYAEDQAGMAKFVAVLLCFIFVFGGFLAARHANQSGAAARNSFVVQDVRIVLPGQTVRGKLVAPNRATIPSVNRLVGMGQQDAIVRHRTNDLYTFVRFVN
jgi:hypothetical protein